MPFSVLFELHIDTKTRYIPDTEPWKNGNMEIFTSLYFPELISRKSFNSFFFQVIN